MAFINGKNIPFVISTIGVNTYVITYPETVTAESKENALAVMKKIYDRLVANDTNFSTVIYVEADLTYYPAGVYLNNGYMEIVSSFTDVSFLSLQATDYAVSTEDITADYPSVSFSNTSKNLYSKPTDGIPIADLAQEVQDSLEKSVPTKVSAFENDSKYLTLDTLPLYDGSVE